MSNEAVILRAKGRISRYTAIPLTGVLFALLVEAFSVLGLRLSLARQQVFLVGIAVGVVFWFYFDKRFVKALERVKQEDAPTETEECRILWIFRIACIGLSIVFLGVLVLLSRA